MFLSAIAPISQSEIESLPISARSALRSTTRILHLTLEEVTKHA